jgi:hypothetical protein
VPDLDGAEPLLFQHSPQRPGGEELDVAPVPTDREMPVPCSRERQGEVLPVPVIGRGQDQNPSRLEQIEGAPEEEPRCVEVLDDFGRDGCVERCVDPPAEVVVDRSLDELEPGIGFASDRDPIVGDLDSS